MITLLVGGPFNGKRMPLDANERVAMVAVSDPVTWQVTERHYYERGDKPDNDARYWLASVYDNVGIDLRLS